MARRRLIHLRPVRPSDVGKLSAWLPRAAADAGCERWADEHALLDAVAQDDVLVADDGGPVAFLSFATGTPSRRAARVTYLAVPPDLRRLGIGGLAVMALERRLARTADEIYTVVPAALGLAFYFWLRLGYRPLTRHEWPAPPEDPPAVWLVRSLVPNRRRAAVRAGAAR